MDDESEQLGFWTDMFEAAVKAGQAGYNLYETQASNEEKKKKEVYEKNVAEQAKQSAAAQAARDADLQKQMAAQKAHPALAKQEEYERKRLERLVKGEKAYQARQGRTDFATSGDIFEQAKDLLKPVQTTFEKYTWPIVIGGAAIVAFLILRRKR